jgi:hypothetical protein
MRLYSSYGLLGDSAKQLYIFVVYCLLYAVHPHPQFGLQPVILPGRDEVLRDQQGDVVIVF